MREAPVLTNRITKGGGGDYQYSTVPPGLRLMGLIRIEDCEITKSAQYGGGTEAGYKFLFQDYQDPDGFCSARVTAKLAPNSKLVKLLSNMLPGRFGKAEQENGALAFNLMQSLPGRWYMCMISHRGDRGDGTPYTNLEGMVATPAPTEQVGNLPPATQRYAEWKKNKENQSHNQGAGRQISNHNGPLPPEAQAPIQTGFENYPDGSLAKTANGGGLPPPAAEETPLFWYKFELNPDAAKAAEQRQWLSNSGFIAKEPGSIFYSHTKDIPELAKRRVDSSTVLFNGDDIPF